MNLFFTVSGLRGIVFSTLTPEYVLKVSAGFCNLFDVPSLIIGRDTRPSGRALLHSVISGAISKGKKVFDGKIAPTPSIVYSVREREKKAVGIVITASHNPPEWNALKFIHPEGRFLFEEEIERLKKEIRFFNWENTDLIGTLHSFDPVNEHVEGILRHPLILDDEIRIRKFKVGIDTGGGAGYNIFPLLLKKLGCEISGINREAGNFKRPFEVNIENIKELGELVKNKNLDIGFAIDADGDRLLIVLKGGEVLSEEDTLPICLYYLLSRAKSNVVTNYSTTEHVEDIAERFNVNVIITKVGEANVVKKMNETNALYGGEGNGGVIVRDFNLTRDAVFASALLLSFLVELGDSREFKKLFRPRFRKKIKIPVTERKIPLNMEKFISSLNSSDINQEDGIRVKIDIGFIHIRLSNTEPVLRIIMETKEREVLREWEEKLKRLL